MSGNYRLGRKIQRMRQDGQGNQCDINTWQGAEGVSQAFLWRKYIPGSSMCKWLEVGKVKVGIARII